MIGHAKTLINPALNRYLFRGSRVGLISGQYVSTESDMHSLNEIIEIIPDAHLSGQGEIMVSCLITDSRRVVPGSLFFAIGGLRTDGNKYVDEAIDRGAAAIVSEAPKPRTINIPYIQVPNVRKALARVAGHFYGNPDQKLQVVGITGTNGKTTVASLAQFMLEKQPGEVGMLGTIHYDLGQRTLPAYKTTPESVDVYAMLSQMYDNGCRRCTMEISSHAIDQLRVDGLNLDVAVFLNLSQDHLDYHGNMDSYFEVKSRMFSGDATTAPRVAVINLDDPYGRLLVELVHPDTQVVTFGEHAAATVRASNVELKSDHSTFDLHCEGKSVTVRTGLLGRYNVSNVLAAMAIAHAAGDDIETLAPKVHAFGGVAGRMEKVDTDLGFQVLVDYAHTNDALDNALRMVKSITRGRVLVVFGCGGNRDCEKRPRMTEAVQKWADYSWATADNPRKEDLDSIFQDMRDGVTDCNSIMFVHDRRRAIGLAIDDARPGDCVVIAGKGHETYQEFFDTIIPFDDRAIAREMLEVRAMRESIEDPKPTESDEE